MPVLESSITLIAGERLYYRGRDAVDLARAASVEAVASLIWTGRLDDARPPSSPREPTSTTSRRKGAFIPRAQAALALASGRDPRGFDLRPESVQRTAWRILDVLSSVASPSAGDDRVDAALARGWRVRAPGDAVLRAAMILCADHELNVSAFTARCVASAGSSPYAVVVAGLSALEGVKHGGSTARVDSLLAAFRRERSLRSAVADRLRQGQHMEGFGHPLYPNGDPRAAALLEMLDEHFRRSPERRFIREVARVTTSVTGETPNVDFALGAVSRVLGLPPRSGLTLFAIGRTIGWIGHAMEQYAVDQIIRPRARYVGPAPGAASG